MKKRFLISLLVALLGCFALEWVQVARAHAGVHDTSVDRKKKKKKKKKKAPKKKKNTSSSGTENKTKSAKELEKEKKHKAKRDKKHEKNVGKIQKERDKKNKKVAKQREKDHEQYDKCDSADVVRTSHDTVLLNKYIKIYRSLGGICYIIHLQDMAKIEKTGDGQYSVTMRPSDNPRAPADWQTYLFCPIGKPDGTVALRSVEGDTVQMCSYFNERKSGQMIYFKKGTGIVHMEKFVEDRKQSDIEAEEEQK